MSVLDCTPCRCKECGNDDDCGLNCMDCISTENYGKVQSSGCTMFRPKTLEQIVAEEIYAEQVREHNEEVFKKMRGE